MVHPRKTVWVFSFDPQPPRSDLIQLFYGGIGHSNHGPLLNAPQVARDTRAFTGLVNGMVDVESAMLGLNLAPASLQALVDRCMPLGGRWSNGGEE